MPEEIKLDLCAQRTEGDKLFRTFVMKRIQERRENLWSPRKKGELQLGKRRQKNGNRCQQEDFGVKGRPMFVCSSLCRPEINLQEAIGTYKFSLMPRSLFATDGEMLHCLTKSTLVTFIEEGASAVDPNNVLSDMRVRRKVVVVSGMAELQSLDKQAEHFTEKVLQKYFESDELHLVFDRYDFPLSLRSATRVRGKAINTQSITL